MLLLVPRATYRAKRSCGDVWRFETAAVGPSTEEGPSTSVHANRTVDRVRRARTRFMVLLLLDC
jgi:hypothetical protein